MEGHPIPQDITGFQFKLIGDMTIKQFAYVASGAVLAWIFYSLPLPGIIKFPFVGFFALLGTGLAFIPIGGRPMDTMVYNFIKALFSPSQYVYQKTGGQLFPATPQTASIVPPIEKPITSPVQEKSFSFSSANPPPIEPLVMPPSSHIITSTVIGGQNQQEEKANFEEKEEERKEVLEKEEKHIEEELQAAKTQEEAINTPTSPEMHQKVLELEKLLQETTAQRQELERQIMALQQKLDNQNYKPPSSATPKRETANVRSIPAGMAKSVGVPIAPDFPNLLTGIVKDPRGNPLPNILVEVKDKEGNPVRAFKTNGLGQFASATTLSNGTYDISFEDPRGQNKFDIAEITATGEIILPLEIISQDAREELRKALFS